MLGIVGGLVAAAFLCKAAPAATQPSPVLIGAVTEAWGPTPSFVGLRDGLIKLGHRENEHFVIGIRFTQGDPDPTRLGTAARQLAEQGAHIIVTAGTNATKAAQLATLQTPIVFMGGSDPVGSGLVESFARPGGNITGVADLDTDLAPKRLEIFRDLIPGLKRILFPYHADEIGAAKNVNLHREAARRLDLTLVERPLPSQAKAKEMLGSLRKGDVDGVFSPRSVALNLPAFILDASMRLSIPAMFHDAIWVEQGGLAGYSANTYEVGRQAARLVDQIIKGAKPANLPVEHATRFDLVLNLRTARALNLVVPPSILLRVDRTIE
jgi:putative ABC transport system substrate-binding protein